MESDDFVESFITGPSHEDHMERWAGRRKEIARLHQEGVSTENLARKYGVSTGRINQIIREAGHPRMAPLKSDIEIAIPNKPGTFVRIRAGQWRPVK